MIVKDEEGIEQALQMLEVSPEGVRYSDRFVYGIVTTAQTLEVQLLQALERGDIVIVVPHGRESEMGDHFRELAKVRKQRAVEEKRKIRDWVTEHPEAIEKVESKLKGEGK